jgi:hypothetical protein
MYHGNGHGRFSTGSDVGFDREHRFRRYNDDDNDGNSNRRHRRSSFFILHHIGSNDRDHSHFDAEYFHNSGRAQWEFHPSTGWSGCCEDLCHGWPAKRCSEFCCEPDYI